MSDREKLIELWETAEKRFVDFCRGQDNCKSCPYNKYGFKCSRAYIIANLISNGVTVQKWIPVSERLPETASEGGWGNYTYQKSVRVLCACVQDSGKRMVKEGYCEYWNEGQKISWKIPGTIDSVTHWMPMPLPHKECE